MAVDLAALRTEYARAGLSERDLDPSPLRQLERWLKDAIDAHHPEPTAMTLATADESGEPSARIVLLKGVDTGLQFFTNYESQKGRELAARPRAQAVLFWVLLERQVRVRGDVTKLAREESEAYFASRPRDAKLGAWASAQSTVLAGREELERHFAEIGERFPGDVPCPPFWGGYRLVPDAIELWQGRPSRLHDRMRYTRIAPDKWTIERLSP
ncbi:MAG TPA: pyridoxamine 5'-phosphate oxidase [Labilithrix sp.]|jgi:pyridoxamine 5'-phosphate oxidase